MGWGVLTASNESTSREVPEQNAWRKGLLTEGRGGERFLEARGNCRRQ